eukprot:TRINITY_DN74388_c0_g1_i1.p1 TRINITY_DN74388_c0_g1~~TRINITY_DN74388_c0_g1_i1.p1  ORF type:complete len:525 (+),score=70.97 TRINITY_DN74388_c0_g1_i1:67-1641(+)
MEGLHSNWSQLKSELSGQRRTKHAQRKSQLDARSVQAEATSKKASQKKNKQGKKQHGIAILGRQAVSGNPGSVEHTKKHQKKAKRKRVKSEPLVGDTKELQQTCAEVVHTPQKQSKKPKKRKWKDSVPMEAQGADHGKKQKVHGKSKQQDSVGNHHSEGSSTLRTETKASVLAALRLELGRWAILDKVVETYDSMVSPVLGGAEDGRAEQKRKRHLEAWLWARLFHPLLPLGQAPAASVELGDASLAQKMENAGLKPMEARRRVQLLDKQLHSGVSPTKGDISVAKQDRGDRITLSCGQRIVEIRTDYLEKLRRMYSGPDFLSSTFLLLARYRILQVHEKGGGNQGAVPRPLFVALQDWAGQPVVEAFASPLNTLAGGTNYYSAFPDVDSSFGSRGSFFNADFTEGIVEVNPPFDQDLIMRVAVTCEDALRRAAAKKKVLAFVIIVPETDWPGHTAFLNSKFKCWKHTLVSGSHFYQVGNQHINTTRSYPASRNTTLLLLASRPMQGSADLRRRMESAFRRPPT